ncbi:hypothetical protein [Ligilactobacillus apodemi]|nr:hypothetical protein [Ligilactobacillus apodemi]MCR1900679.1 hypothetical protein [Ligilactobacillus apodemi]
MIFSSHILSFVTDLCNKVIFIAAGRLQKQLEGKVTEKDLMGLFNEIKD